MFGAIARIASKVVRPATSAVLSAGRAASKIPGVGAIPVVGNVLAAAGGLAAVSSMVGGGSSGSLPALPSGMNLPVPGMGAPTTMGDRSIFRNDPNVIEAVKPWAISKANLKTYYRAPKGFVIVYDSAGDPYALPRKMAMWLKLWKPAHKPPISVGDWQAVKRADRTVKRMKKIFRVTTSVDKNITGGRVVVKRRKKVA